MTNQTTTTETASVNNEDLPEPTTAEIEAARREMVFASPDKSGPELYPRMFNLSSGFAYDATLRALEPAAPEYLTV